MTPARKAQLISYVGAGLVHGILSTLRFRVEDEAGVFDQDREHALIWAFWHNRLFVIPYVFHRWARRPGVALTSASKDGEILAAFLERFNVKPVRGSTSRRGATALRELRRYIQNKHDAAITPDGPRGPCYHLNPGVVALAQTTGALLMPVRVAYSSAWRLRSWDRFLIPKPFATAEVRFLEPYNVPKTNTQEEFEAECRKIRLLLGTDEVTDGAGRV